MSNETEKTINVDPGMNEDPRDTKEIDAVEGEDDLVSFDLVTGQCLTTKFNEMNWEGIYEQIPELDRTLLSIKKIMYDLISAEPTGRLDMVLHVLADLQGLHEQLGLDTQIEYHIRDGISEYERAILMCTNCIIILSDMIHTAQLANYRTHVNTIEEMAKGGIASLFNGGGLMDDFLQETSNEMDEINEEIESNEEEKNDE